MTPSTAEHLARLQQRLADLDLKALAGRIGLEHDGGSIVTPYFGVPYRVNAGGVVGPDYREASPAMKSVLLPYLLQFPAEAPEQQDWISYRDFPEAAPFAGTFRAHVEMTLARVFTGKRLDLMTSCAAVGGLTPSKDFDYEAAFVFQALPHLDLLLLFNDADEIFPAKCLVMFDENADRILDMESLSSVGWRLAYLIFNMSGFELPEE